MKNLLTCSFVKALAEGSAGLFDIFGQRAPVVKLGTLADDVQRVGDDFRTIGKDFAAVLSRKEFLNSNE